MLEHSFVQKVYKTITKRNAYGDLVRDYSSTEKPVACRFRIISEVSSSDNREERRSSQAMLWVAPTAPLKHLDVVRYGSTHWQITGIVEARKLGSNKVEFLKCTLSAYDIIS